MMKIFYGDDRIGAEKEIKRFFGEDYEVVEGENLEISDMPSLFFGETLFGEKRRILIKDLSEKTACWSEFIKYLDTEHEVVVWESKIDKRTATYKDLLKQNKNIEMREFKSVEPPEKKLVFDVFDTAWRGDGMAAVAIVEKIEITNDPYMFMGLMVSQVLKKIDGSFRTERAVKILAECDMKMKTTGFEPWILVKSALLQIAG